MYTDNTHTQTHTHTHTNTHTQYVHVCTLYVYTIYSLTSPPNHITFYMYTIIFHRPADKGIPMKQCAAYGDVHTRQRTGDPQDVGIYDNPI